MNTQGNAPSPSTITTTRSTRLGSTNVGVLHVEVFENPRSFGLAFSAYGARTVLTVCGEPTVEALDVAVSDALQHDPHGFSAAAAEWAAPQVAGFFFLTTGS